MSEREIFCDECGDCAVEVDQGALGEDLDGIHAACQACNVDGKYEVKRDGLLSRAGELSRGWGDGSIRGNDGRPVSRAHGSQGYAMVGA